MGAPVVVVVYSPPTPSAPFPSLSLRINLSMSMSMSRSLEGKTSASDPLSIQCGVLQGDVLSPILFCLAIAPLSFYLNGRYGEAGYAFARGASGRPTKGKPSQRITHQFYVDDLKLYSCSQEGLTAMLRGLRSLCTKLGFRFNPAKCATACYGSSLVGNMRHEADIPLLGARDAYKYLGVEQDGAYISGEKAWDRVRAKALGTAARLFESNLFLNGKIQGYNACVMPALKFFFLQLFAGGGKGVKFETQVKWAKEYDTALIKLLSLDSVRLRFNTMNSGRVFLKRDVLGLGLVSCEATAYESLAYAYCYLTCTPELKSAYDIFSSAANRSKRTVVKDFQQMIKRINETGTEGERIQLKVIKEIDGVKVNGTCFVNPTLAARSIVTVIRNNMCSQLMTAWKGKTVAGRVPCDPHLSSFDSPLWLKKGHLQTLAVRNCMAVQEEQVWGLRGHPGNPSQVRTCRLCKRRGVLETAKHVVADCEYFRPTLMRSRHDSVCRKIYNALCKAYGFTTVHYTQAVPVSQISYDGTVELWWDRNINTVVKLAHNRPDLVLIDRAQGKVFVLEVSVSWFSRLGESTERKRQRYAVNSCLENEQEVALPFPPGDNLAGELQNMLGLTVNVIPVVVGTCGEVLPSLRENLSKVPAWTQIEVTQLVERMQRTTVIGTSRILRTHLANQ